jgi:hypothetical protein
LFAGPPNSLNVSLFTGKNRLRITVQLFSLRRYEATQLALREDDNSEKTDLDTVFGFVDCDAGVG